MKTPRLKRLGLISVASALALVGAVLSPAVAAGPSSPSGIVLTKSWSATPVNSGSNVVATITVSNPTGSAINNVAVTDIYDPGLTFVSASASGGGSCLNDNSVGFRRVNCTIPSVAATNFETITINYTANYWGYRHYTKNYLTDERLEIQKAETHVDILSGDTTTATVSCPAGYDILDYSWHLQQVDQDTGDFYDIYMVSSNIFNSSASVTLFNDAGGKAQGKLWALCLKNTTNHAHPVVWGVQQSETHTEAPDGPYERPFYAECPQGYTPMAINLSAVSNGFSDPDSIYMDDRISQTGLEADGSRRATVWAIVKDHADVTLKWRCLGTSIGANRLWFGTESATVFNVPMHDKVAQKQITCDHGYKGVIGGWRGGHFNGSEPRPITRVYWLWHDGPGVKHFTGKLLCLQSRLMRGGKVQKNGTITDILNNHARGMSETGTQYVVPVEASPSLVVKQTS